MTRFAFGGTWGSPAANCSLASLSPASSDAVATSPRVFDRPRPNERRDIDVANAFSITGCSLSSHEFVKVQDNAGHCGVSRQSSKIHVGGHRRGPHAAQLLRVSRMSSV